MPNCEQLSKVLEDEFERTHGPLPPSYRLARDGLDSTRPAVELEGERLKLIYAQVHALEEKRTALCLSGGGIRSATFGLGVLQGLAKRGLLGQFDFLSTVSGGGYIGSWLTAWAYHCDGDWRKVISGLACRTPNPNAPQAAPVGHLRDYSNYLAPQLGILSVDTWTLLASYFRNLLLNWLVLVPLLSAVLMGPRLYLLLTNGEMARTLSEFGKLALNAGTIKHIVHDWGALALFTTGFVGHVIAIVFADASRPSLSLILAQAKDKPVSCLTPLVRILSCLNGLGNGPGRQVVPLVATAGALSVSAICFTVLWHARHGESVDFVMKYRPSWIGHPTRLSHPIVLTQLAIGLAVWLLNLPRYVVRRAYEKSFGCRLMLLELVVILAVSYVTGRMLVVMANRELLGHTRPYAIFAAPCYLLAVLVVGVLYRGLTSAWTPDDDREWSGRAAGGLLICIVGWILIAEVSLMLPSNLLEASPWLRNTVFSAGGAAGVLTALLGRSGKTPATREQAAKPGSPANANQGGKLGLGAVVSQLGLYVAAPVFVLVTGVVLSLAIDWILLRMPVYINDPNIDNVPRVITAQNELAVWLDEQRLTIDRITGDSGKDTLAATEALLWNWQNRPIEAVKSLMEPKEWPGRAIGAKPLRDWLNEQAKALQTLQQLYTPTVTPVQYLDTITQPTTRPQKSARGRPLRSAPPVTPAPASQPAPVVRPADEMKTNAILTLLRSINTGTEPVLITPTTAPASGPGKTTIKSRKHTTSRPSTPTTQIATPKSTGLNDVVRTGPDGIPRLVDAEDWHAVIVKNSSFLQNLRCTLLLIVGGLFAGLVIDINTFSLHGIYRNRLIRAYLGASRPRREFTPTYSGFTGFDAADDIPMSDLAKHVDAFNRVAIIDPDRWAQLLREATKPQPLQSQSSSQNAVARLLGRSYGIVIDSQLNHTELPANFATELENELDALVASGKLLDDAFFSRYLKSDELALLKHKSSDDLHERFCRRLSCLVLHRALPEVVPRPGRLFHVLNMAMNLSVGANLAWQQRKARSFTATPLYCGSYRLGYRSSDEYGRDSYLARWMSKVDQGGLTLGTAMAVSGAAVNPNCGYHTSPAIAFLLTLLNVRLGVWMGNPGPAGDTRLGTTAQSGSPTQSVSPLFAEATGRTDDQYRYVSLSDGGHFDNLGLYEMVLRRCSTIVLSDAGQDSLFTFEDLGNAMRKTSIDLGVPVTFVGTINMRSRINATDANVVSQYCAVGTIRYSAVDPDASDGTIIYIKPAFYGDEPVDVYNYAKQWPEFPHESTANQFFTEGQFESYRRLGEHIVDQVTRYPGARGSGLPRFISGARSHFGLPTVFSIAATSADKGKSTRLDIKGAGFSQDATVTVIFKGMTWCLKPQWRPGSSSDQPDMLSVSVPYAALPAASVTVRNPASTQSALEQSFFFKR